MKNKDEKMKQPAFLIYWKPLLEVLKEMGGAGSRQEVIDGVVEKMKISDAELEIKIPSGTSRVHNLIQWAKGYLTKLGYIDGSVRGLWRLTEKGLKANITENELLDLLKKAREEFNKSSKPQNSPKAKQFEEELEVEEDQHNHGLIDILKNLSPGGFERICKRLLTECGFQQVEVTGRSNDHGIDGIGLLEVNELVTFKVLFQCKRYKETVSPSQVRDFRGAMQGRAEKGIIITTGRFTHEARLEAKRDGVTPIELVDGDKLVDMFEKYELGLKPKTVYDIDLSFFEEFK